ncbi:MAG: ribonuclease III [Clostridia bacterium]|nr:ribonuclease III [Clostridia bacterium]
MKNFEEKIGYRFHNRAILETAITHSSYANEKKKESNERLEFLGDSVLSLIVSNYLYKNLSDTNEGDLTKIRASLVCEQSLAELAKGIGVGEYIKLGKGEEQTGGRGRPSVLSDAFEAILAAIYLDGGINIAEKWLIGLMDEKLKQALSGEIYHDYKSMLQEAVQRGNIGKVTYTTIKETGPDHNKYFEVEVCIDGEAVSIGTGQSKKEAEQNAAKNALGRIKP